jgi:hypothetical protein
MFAIYDSLETAKKIRPNSPKKLVKSTFFIGIEYMDTTLEGEGKALFTASGL